VATIPREAELVIVVIVCSVVKQRALGSNHGQRLVLEADLLIVHFHQFHRSLNQGLLHTCCINRCDGRHRRPIQATRLAVVLWMGAECHESSISLTLNPVNLTTRKRKSGSKPVGVEGNGYAGEDRLRTVLLP